MAVLRREDKYAPDFKANPKRYVHFSLFGGKEKKSKTDVSPK
jgi:hypothetical protein